MNIIQAPIVYGGADLNGFTVPVKRSCLDKAASGKVLAGARPEDLHIATEGAQLRLS